MKARIAAALAAACLATSAVAQDGEGLVTVGPGGEYDLGPNVPTWNRVFDLALALEGPGADLWVLPGVYEFPQFVRIAPNRPRVTIRGGEGVLLRGAQGNSGVGLFRVDADDATFIGMTFQARNTPVSQDLIRVTGSRFTLRNCVFNQNACLPEGEKLVQLAIRPSNVSVTDPVEPGGTPPFRETFHIHGNTFLFARCPGTNPVGLVFGIEARQVHDLHCRENDFRGLEDESEFERAIELVDAVASEISDNVFVGLGEDPMGMATGEAVILARNTDLLEGARNDCVVRGNFFEPATVKYLVELRGVTGYAVTGNIFGRGIGGVRIEPALTGNQPSREVLVWGNQFHNVSAVGLGASAVSADTAETVSITHNQYTLCRGTQVFVTGVHHGLALVGNQFTLDLLDSGNACQPVHITWSSGMPGGVVTHNNAAMGFVKDGLRHYWKTPVTVVGTPASGRYSESKNWSFPTCPGTCDCTD